MGLLEDIGNWVAGPNSILGSGGQSGWGGLDTVGKALPWLPTVIDLVRSEDDKNYQRNLTKEQMEREDTAVQRRVADLKAAGLHPSLAAGSAASTATYIGAKSPMTQDILGNAIQNELVKNNIAMSNTQRQINEQKLKQEKVITNYMEQHNKPFGASVLGLPWEDLKDSPSRVYGPTKGYWEKRNAEFASKSQERMNKVKEKQKKVQKDLDEVKSRF